MLLIRSQMLCLSKIWNGEGYEQVADQRWEWRRPGFEGAHERDATRGRPKIESSGDVGAWKNGCVRLCVFLYGDSVQGDVLDKTRSAISEVLTAIKLARISSPAMSPNGHSHLTRVPWRGTRAGSFCGCAAISRGNVQTIVQSNNYLC